MDTKPVTCLTTEFILSFKNICNNATNELDQLFESINSSFISSTNKNDKYKHIKIVRVGKKSSNKWKLSLNSANNLTTLIKNILNKISVDNFEKLSTELILKLQIDNYTSLLVLANELFNRILINPVYIDIYIKLIMKILCITKDIWQFNENNLQTVLINMAQQKFYTDYLKNDIEELNNLYDTDFLSNITTIELEGLCNDEKIVKKKSMSLSNIKFIVKIYQKGLLDKKPFENIVNILIQQSCINSVESLIEILNVFEEEDDVLQKLSLKLNKISKKKSLDFRLQFIYEEALKRYYGKQTIKITYNKTTFNNKIETKKIYQNGCINIIDEYIELEEYNEVKEFLYESNNNYTELCYFVEILFFKTVCGLNKDYTKLKNLFKQINKEKLLKLVHIKKGINYLIQNCIDLKMDYPTSEENIKKFIKFLTLNKILKKDYLEEIMGKLKI